MTLQLQLVNAYCVSHAQQQDWSIPQ